MATKKIVKKVRIKKKNFAIFLIVLFVVVFLLVQIIFHSVMFIYHLFNKPVVDVVETPTPSISTKPTNTPTTSPSSDNSVNDNSTSKLDQLNRVDLKLDYFNYEYLNRYIEYKNNNPDLSSEDIVMDVNIGLDYPHYENTTLATDTDSYLVLVNKYHPLPDDYSPNDLKAISKSYALDGMKLRTEAKDAFSSMASAAEKENLNIIAMSAFRSYDYQVGLYNRYKRKDGQEVADTYSGRPGFSEHQSGLAVDVYNGKLDYTSFHKTKEFIWMQENAHLYGFILRFPKEKEKRTGYHYESWHYRYVGTHAAKIIHDEGLCLEEYIVKYVETKKD